MSKIFTIENKLLSVGIKALGAELQYIRNSNGVDFLWNGDPSVWSGRAPVLFPICGGLKGDVTRIGGKEYKIDKHGFAKGKEFECVSNTEDSISFKLSYDEGSLTQYPYKFELYITYTLSGNSLGVKYEVKNIDEGELYFSVGGHEGYLCPEGIEAYDIVFDTPQTLDTYSVTGPLLDGKCSRVLEATSILPLKNEYFAVDALIFKQIGFNRVTLAHRGGSRRISVSLNGFENLLIWTKPESRLLCIEPWQGLPDSLDSSGEFSEKESILRVDPGQSHTSVHEIEFDI